MTSGTTAPADVTASPDLTARVAAVVKSYTGKGAFPGLTVAVVNDGKVTLMKGYGVADVASGSPVGADTELDIGSVTKTFTALGVLLLYQESQGTSHPINLDAPIGPYFRGDRSFHLPRAWSRITTRELLDMSSGIRNGSDSLPWRAQIASIATAPLLYAPGTESSYSDTNYDLLGALIERWTGQSYSTFIDSRILDPLGMGETQVLGRSPTVSGQATGYGAPAHGRWPKAAPLNGVEMYAAAGMVSTAHDMAEYMQALLAGRLLDPATYRMMWSSTPTPELHYGSGPAPIDYRGLGWDMAVGTAAGAVQVTKSGQVPGFTSQMILYPSANSGVFVSFNTNHHAGPMASGAIAYQLAEDIYQATVSTASPAGPASGGG